MGFFRRDPKPQGNVVMARVVSYGRGKGYGEETRPKNARVNVRLDAEIVDPQGGVRTHSVKGIIAGDLAWLIEEGMEIPVRLDAATGRVLGFDEDALRSQLSSRQQEVVDQRREEAKLTYNLPKASEVKDALATPRELLRLPGAIKRSLQESPPDDGGLAANDPALEAIEGVSFETWVSVQAGLVRERVRPRDYDAFAQQHGVAPGRWNDIERAWRARLKGNPGLAQRFGVAYQREVSR